MLGQALIFLWVSVSYLVPAYANTQTPVRFTPSITTSFGFQPLAYEARPSFNLEPKLSVSMDHTQEIVAQAALEQFLYSSQNPTTLPYVEALYRICLYQTPSLQIKSGIRMSALELERWMQEGWTLREALFFQLESTLLRSLKWEFSVSGFHQTSLYRQDMTGMTQIQGGFTQQAGLLLDWGHFLFELGVLASEYQRVFWNTSILSQEKISFRFANNLLVGIGHQYLFTALEPENGFFRNFGFFDRQKSRFLAFARWQI